MFIIRIIHIKYILLIICLFMTNFISLPQSTAQEKNNSIYFEALKKKLIKDGFDKKAITDIYNNPKVYFETKGVSLFLIHREAKLNYDQFTSPKSIERARQYIEKHKHALGNAEKKYGVSKEVITAIILIETRLGTNLGGPSIINTLSTIASLADHKVRDIFWSKISDTTRLTRKEFKKWVNKKSKWAYKELEAFLKYTSREKIDPVDVIGSYAGAIGISQFMPSSIVTFAKDGDNDGRIDLFNHADAIMSVAYYLKHYGWNPGIEEEKAYKVIHHYNHSSYYVHTVLKVLGLLKG